EGKGAHRKHRCGAQQSKMNGITVMNLEHDVPPYRSRRRLALCCSVQTRQAVASLSIDPKCSRHLFAKAFAKWRCGLTSGFQRSQAATPHSNADGAGISPAHVQLMTTLSMISIS